MPTREELERRLQEAEERLTATERKLKQAQNRAQETMREIWQIDMQLERAESRAREAEQKLQQQAEPGRLGGSLEQAQATREAQERAHLAEEKLEALSHSTAAFESQLAEIQARVREAETRAEEWEERFHRSEERAVQAEAQVRAGGGGEVEQLRERLELANEKSMLLETKVKALEERAATAEAEAKESRNKLLRAEAVAQEAQEKLKAVESRSGDSLRLVEEAEKKSEEADQKVKQSWERIREAELKAHQASVQLQKAEKRLKEYEERAHESDRETQRLAFQDNLTGLPNLNLIRQYLDFTVKQVSRYGRASALLVVDLDRFKVINDAMGFKAGDELLVRVSERLQAAIRESDALGRRGEDEFLILLSDLYTGDENVPEDQKASAVRRNIEIVIHRIMEGLARPFTIQGQKFYLRASIGISVCPNDARTTQEMLEHADGAMYYAKESGRGRAQFYTSDLHKKQERRLALDSQLRVALEKGEFVLYYQPIVEFGRGKATMVGVEALVRWNHRLEGLVEPRYFLPIAEETGLIVQIGQWVVRQACWQLQRWVSQGLRLFISVNLSTRQMLQADLAETLVDSVKEHQLPPELLFVEIAEGMNTLHADLIDQVVNQLGAEGIRIAIDDFGTGFTSLTRFNLSHTHILKIDPSIVSGCPKNKQSTSICTAAITLAHSLGLVSLAEGVEDVNQVKFLVKHGCKLAQGFHFSEPVLPDIITGMGLEKKSWRI